ncbi:MAG: 4-hydroxythreonine-4-phosphate dehydrogenase PdxA [Acidobacteriota bacterium]|nr:4-hydroxythreonine-4-phosphate dehydrogenase PdxA [Acidobacteriota bacterium]
MPNWQTIDKEPNMLYGITMGDSSGIGPEILLKAYRAGEIEHDFIVYGDYSALAFYNERLNYGVTLRRATDPADREPLALNILDAGLLRTGEIAPGKLSRASGHAAREYVIAATRAALAKEIAAMVTLPMNKEATQLSDPHFTGHTELIGELCGARDVTIMLASDQLIVTHVSTHVSLATAIERAKKERICTILRLTTDALRRLMANPRIAVAGLNPHAGENGLFGDEEIREIRPAVEWAQAQGMPVEGPFPPDTIFYMTVRKKLYDAVVCMYHDQGHVPSKLLDFEGGVNVALGLPIVRTSVDHGTAFDIAGTGVASTTSLISALNFAVKMSEGTH